MKGGGGVTQIRYIWIPMMDISEWIELGIESDPYRIAGNFRGRKLSRISRFLSHPRKFSPQNSRHATPTMRPVLTFRENFLREMLLSYRSAKVFSLENFPPYGIILSRDLILRALALDRELQRFSMTLQRSFKKRMRLF